LSEQRFGIVLSVNSCTCTEVNQTETSHFLLCDLSNRRGNGVRFLDGGMRWHLGHAQGRREVGRGAGPVRGEPNEWRGQESVGCGTFCSKDCERCLSKPGRAAMYHPQFVIVRHPLLIVTGEQVLARKAGTAGTGLGWYCRRPRGTVFDLRPHHLDLETQENIVISCKRISSWSWPQNGASNRTTHGCLVLGGPV
jgi:hypothetical protein